MPQGLATVRGVLMLLTTRRLGVTPCGVADAFASKLGKVAAGLDESCRWSRASFFAQ